MAYSNVSFDIKTIYTKLPVLEVEVPLTKKKRIPDLKKVKAPYGSIISLRHGNDYRGIVTKPVLNTKNFFLNQVSCVLSLTVTSIKNLHIMMFKDSLKIAGCKSTSQAIEAVELLWDAVKKIKDSYTITDNSPPTFIFDTVMTNVDFKLGFNIDRKKLNNLVNDKKYKHLIQGSRFETTGNTNVNIKLYSHQPDDFRYQCLTIDKTPIVTSVPENKYAKKKQRKNTTTFLVFRSSKVIESGRFIENMRNGYDEFIKIISENRHLIEEKINKEDEEYVH